MKKLLILHAIAQVGDAASTFINLKFFGFTEANPLMAVAFAAHPAYFFLAKLLATATVTWLLWTRRHYRSAVLTAWAITFAMWGVVLWNVMGAALYVT